MRRLQLILRNLLRHPLRSCLTAATIALATFMFAVLVSVPASMDKIVSDASTTLRVVINNRTGPWYGLPPRYCDQIGKMSGVVACASLRGWPAKYRDDRDEIMAFAVSDDLGRVFPDYGLRPHGGFTSNRRAASVGYLLMKKYGWKVGDQIMLKSASADQMELSFVIVEQIPSTKYPNSFIFRRTYWAEAAKAAGIEEDDVAWMLMARVDRAEHLPMVTREIDETFRNSDYETKTVTEADAISTGLSAVGNIRGIVYSLTAVVMLTVLLIAANATAMMVRDRLADVAVMRALGFSQGTVGTLLFGECAVLGLAGGAAGAGVAYVFFHKGVSLGAVMGGGLGAFFVPTPVTLEAIVAAILVSVLSAAVPGINALRITPAAAFRQVV